MNPTVKSIVWAIVALTLGVLAARVVMAVYAPDADANGIIGILAPTIASLGALIGVGMVKGDTDKVLNGAMEEKVKRATAEILGLDTPGPTTLHDDVKSASSEALAESASVVNPPPTSPPTVS